MRHSLCHRFEGGLLGSLLGEMAASLHFTPGKGKLEAPLSPEMQVAFSLLAPLIQSGQLSEEDWQQINRQQGGPLERAGSGELAVMTLPLALFFHDSPCRFHDQIRAACQVGQLPAEVMADVILWGRGIALALQEKLRADCFCQQLLAGEPRDLWFNKGPITWFLLRELGEIECMAGILLLREDANSPTLLRHQLQKIQPCRKLGLPLSQAISRLSRQRQSSGGKIFGPLTAALYCFSQTPEDFSLCVLRTVRSSPQTRLSGILAGAIAGAYNSISGIPSHWRLAIQQQPTAREVTRQIPALFASWLGHYNPQSFIPRPELAAASPNVIQPRPSLQIISQQADKISDKRGEETVK